MGFKIKTIPLDKDTIESSNNILFDDGVYYIITPFFEGRDTATYTYKLTTATDGDSQLVIGKHAIQVDGEYIFMVSWDDGMLVYKIADDGQLTRVYWDDSPGLFNQSYLSSLILDRANKKGWVARDYTDGIQQFDYSDIANGNITWEQVVYYSTDTTAGLNSNRIGYSYEPGMVMAGQWIYYTGQDTTNAARLYLKKQGRWNPYTGVFEELDVQGLDTYMRRGRIYYDEVADRVYTTGFYNGELWVTVNASSDTAAKCYQIDYSALGLGAGDDNYPGIVIPMLYNRDHILIGGNYGHLDIIDISQNLDDSRTTDIPVKVAGTVTAEYQLDIGFVTYPWVGRPTPTSELIMVWAEGHWFRKNGWIDMEFGNHVGSMRHYNLHQSRDYLEFGYTAVPKKAISPNGTEYWISAGYNYDGRYVYVHTPAQGGEPKLASSSDITFGNSKLNVDGKNILGLVVNMGDLLHTPSGTSYTIAASNNGGVTWETVLPDETHIFSSKGSDVKVKISFSNPYYKATYVMSKGAINTKSNGLTVTLITDEKDVSNTSPSFLETMSQVFIARRRGLGRQRR